jgi:hypothetical protein
MPIAPWSATKVGLGLWNSVAGTIVVESVMFAAAVSIYARATRARDRTGTINLWVYVAVLAAMYVANIIGPPPPDVRSLAIVALGLWLLPLWAEWIDRHRRALTS